MNRALRFLAIAGLSSSVYAGSCPPGWGGTQPERVRKTATHVARLLRQQVFSGPIPYAATFPELPLYNANLLFLENPNRFQIALVPLGQNTGACATDPASLIVLAPGARTSSDQIQKTFGSEQPALPVAIVACADTGVLPEIAVTVGYSYFE